MIHDLLGFAILSLFAAICFGLMVLQEPNLDPGGNEIPEEK